MTRHDDTTTSSDSSSSPLFGISRLGMLEAHDYLRVSGLDLGAADIGPHPTLARRGISRDMDSAPA